MHIILDIYTTSLILYSKMHLQEAKNNTQNIYFIIKCILFLMYNADESGP